MNFNLFLLVVVIFAIIATAYAQGPPQGGKNKEINLKKVLN